jgi:hypothetical protein
MLIPEDDHRNVMPVKNESFSHHLPPTDNSVAPQPNIALSLNSTMQTNLVSNTEMDTAATPAQDDHEEEEVINKGEQEDSFFHCSNAVPASSSSG